MKEKNIDDLLMNIDSLLDISETTPKFKIEEVSQKLNAKQLKEQKGNAQIIIGTIFLGISIFLLIPDFYSRINMITLTLYALIVLWINHQAKVKIQNQNMAINFTEFQEQRKTIASTLLKQFKIMRLLSYMVILSTIGLASYQYYEARDLIGLIGTLLGITIGSFITIRAIEGAIQDYRRLLKD